MNIEAFNHGFAEKCAEFGINASNLAKFAYSQPKNNVPVAATGGAVLGVVLGALRKAENRKERLRNMAIYGIAGGAAGAGAGYVNDAARDRINDLELAAVAGGKANFGDYIRARMALKDFYR